MILHLHHANGLKALKKRLRKLPGGNLVLCFFLLGTMAAVAQTNALTKSEFYKIKFNNISFTDLSNTEGVDYKVTKLIGFPDRVREGQGGVGEGWRRFEYNSGFAVTYIDIASEDYKPSVSFIRATSITINGVTAKIGDSISVFKASTTTADDGATSVQYITESKDCCPITIEFDAATKTITKIGYKVSES